MKIDLIFLDNNAANQEIYATLGFSKDVPIIQFVLSSVFFAR